ncbi:hypothetical protein Tco_0780258, partial [Tanacetum coccineum]
NIRVISSNHNDDGNPSKANIKQALRYEAREKEAEPIIGVAGTRFGIYKAIISPNCPSSYLGYKWTSDPADEFDERVGAFHIVS